LSNDAKIKNARTRALPSEAASAYIADNYRGLLAAAAPNREAGKTAAGQNAHGAGFGNEGDSEGIECADLAAPAGAHLDTAPGARLCRRPAAAASPSENARKRRNPRQLWTGCGWCFAHSRAPSSVGAGAVSRCAPQPLSTAMVLTPTAAPVVSSRTLVPSMYMVTQMNFGFVFMISFFLS
jgi:hypothetical protein